MTKYIFDTDKEPCSDGCCGGCAYTEVVEPDDDKVKEYYYNSVSEWSTFSKWEDLNTASQNLWRGQYSRTKRGE